MVYRVYFYELESGQTDRQTNLIHKLFSNMLENVKKSTINFYSYIQKQNISIKLIIIYTLS